MDHSEHTEWVYKMSLRKGTTLNLVFKCKYEKENAIGIDIGVSERTGTLF